MDWYLVSYKNRGNNGWDSFPCISKTRSFSGKKVRIHISYRNVKFYFLFKFHGSIIFRSTFYLDFKMHAIFSMITLNKYRILLLKFGLAPKVWHFRLDWTMDGRHCRTWAVNWKKMQIQNLFTKNCFNFWVQMVNMHYLYYLFVIILDYENDANWC